MLDAADLKVDKFYSRGPDPAGPVDAALRITHIPTGIVGARQVTARSREEADAELRKARSEILREIEGLLNAESE